MKLSIITVNLNNAEGLRKTIESVVSQTYTDFEYIVIDGASNDGSVDVIKEYVEKITYWVSEPDKGIYNAMNKGIKVANGEYLLFLNSGDWLYNSSVLYDIYNNFDVSADVVSGNMILKNYNNDEIWDSKIIDKSLFEIIYERSLPHQATFIKRDLFLKFGYYYEANKIVSDREFFLKALVYNKSSFMHVDLIVSCYDMTGISASSNYKNIMSDEVNKMFDHYMTPMVYRAYKQQKEKNNQNEQIVSEYLNLKNGKLGFVIKGLLNIKKMVRRYGKL